MQASKGRNRKTGHLGVEIRDQKTTQPIDPCEQRIAAMMTS